MIYVTIARLFVSSADFAKAKTEQGVKHSQGKRQRTGYYGDDDEKPTTDELRTTTTLKDFVDFYSTLLTVSTQEDDLATPFLRSLHAAVPRLPNNEMHGLWIGFLCSIIPQLPAHGIPYTNPDYQQLFRSILTHYITQYVGKKPIPSTSLVRPRVECSCGHCALLNNFLVDPTKSVERYGMKKVIREHLESMLEKHKIDCTHVTERNTNPHTLVVTKTFKMHDQLLKAWHQRKVYAEGRLQPFHQMFPSTPELKLLLGEQYDRIMRMEDTYNDTPTTFQSAAPTSAVSSSGNAPSGPVAGIKRSRSNDDLADGR